MGNDANAKTGKSTNPNPKVPPIKIVLSASQNSAVVNICNQQQGEGQSEVDAKKDTSGHDSDREGNNSDVKESQGTKVHKKTSQASHIDMSRYYDQLGSISTSSASDCSTSTSPNSESDSNASVSTIISDSQQHVKLKIENKEETAPTRREKEYRSEAKNSSSNTESKTSSSSRRSHDSSVESGQNESVTSYPKEHTNANQRITRSSQRAAQQNRAELNNDPNNEDQSIPENHEKPSETSRKTKRRRGEPQDVDQEGNQANTQPTLTMANICPADYKLPSQNSFELYRDIRKRPYKKMMQLNHIQPRVPRGFKDYLINGGPYLLDGNKLGVGLSGQRVGVGLDARGNVNDTCFSSRPKMPVRLSNLRVPPNNLSKLKHYNYNIPKPCEVPKKLAISSSLHDLFVDQEKARQQMRLQHLKERERSILAAEQEILRAYSKIAIADNRQELHLSACTYFYYQERYHYIDERTESEKMEDSKGVSHCQDTSSLCKDGDELSTNEVSKNSLDTASTSLRGDSLANEKCQNSQGKNSSKDVDVTVSSREEEKAKSSTATDRPKSAEDDRSTRDGKSIDTSDTTSTRTNSMEENSSEHKKGSSVKEDKSDGQIVGTSESTSTGSVEQGTKCEGNANLSDSELRSLNKRVFLDHLQEIDDKWAKVRLDMYTRHKNESDSLYAVQTLDWEWKAKEIGACDVRVSLRIEPDLVPRVEVSKLDY